MQSQLAETTHERGSGNQASEMEIEASDDERRQINTELNFVEICQSEASLKFAVL